MTYFNLRKRDAAPEPEDPADAEETEAEPNDTPQAAAEPANWPQAIWFGLCGPWRWFASRFGDYGVTSAWILHIGSLWAFVYYGGWIATGLALTWSVAVLAFIPQEFLDRLTAAIERLFIPASKPAARPAQGGEREAVRRLLLDVIGDAHGVHLKTVLAHLQEHGQWEGRKVADLRVHLEALGIPVDPKLKVAGVPTRGVLRTALEALPPVRETSPSPNSSPPV